MKTTNHLCLQVTSDSGNIVTPMLTYDYKCKNCGAPTQLAKISGFGLPESMRTRLFFETLETFKTECGDCGDVDLIRTEVTETGLVEIVETKGANADLR
jgi:Ribonuclease G/E